MVRVHRTHLLMQVQTSFNILLPFVWPFEQPVHFDPEVKDRFTNTELPQPQ